MDTCGFYTDRGRVVRQQQVRGAVQVTHGLAPAESPVPPHPYACACSGLLGTALKNSHIGCLLGPTGGMESDSVHVPPWCLHTLGCPQEFL